MSGLSEGKMKASCVLLRWYKSFNVNYLGYPDRRHQVKNRPWTALGVPREIGDRWPFIEIPLESDITTIVGANESGKSHLLSAIAKVITGKGLPDERDRFLPFDKVDLCHYASVRNKNASAWPNIGIEFSEVSDAEWARLSDAVRQALTKTDRFTLILAAVGDTVKVEENGPVAYLYLGDASNSVSLSAAQLAAVRKCLPTLRFIKSDVAMRDELPVDDLLASLGHPSSVSRTPFYPFTFAQNIAGLVAGLVIPAEGQVDAKTLSALRTAIAAKDAGAQREEYADTSSGRAKQTLEAMLFADVLGIKTSAIELLATLPDRNRSYADSLVATWNDEIGRVLNLSRYWQQDELFSLRINFKRGVLFFELTDKTGYVYTFRERSSGLRYFLSYYVQAKALEMSLKESNAIILMDEPDSYLSIVGQRSLLAVFEGLAGMPTTGPGVQLMYTTHSPFLINRNFPRRIRLVRKGDGEEGSQYVDESRLRRYEPVRSALGIDCAQTLFMGSANLLLEGPTDQFLLTELIRAFSTPQKMHDLIDLNSITVVSAESAPDVARVIQASVWGDESFPATVVLFDDDDEGRKQQRRITGKANSGQERKENGGPSKELIKSEFVLVVTDILKGAVPEGATRTIEDLVPPALWSEAVAAYINEWCPTISSERTEEICRQIAAYNGEKEGLLAATAKAFAHADSAKQVYIDKMGLFQAVVKRVRKSAQEQAPPTWRKDLEERIVEACRCIKASLEESRVAQRRNTGKQGIRRLAADFLIQHPNRTGLFDLEQWLLRISKDAELLGEDGASLKEFVGGLGDKIRKLRSEEVDVFEKDLWNEWRKKVIAIRDNPLAPEKSLGMDVTDAVAAPEPPAAQELPTAQDVSDPRVSEVPAPAPEVATKPK